MGYNGLPSPLHGDAVRYILPLAGEGVRFQGYSDKPKYLIDVMGQPMISHGIAGLQCKPEEIVVVVQKEHNEKFNVGKQIKMVLGKKVIVVEVGRTCGATETVLLGIENGGVAAEELICVKDADCISIPKPNWRKKVEQGAAENDEMAWVSTYNDQGPPAGGLTNKSHVRLEDKSVIEIQEKIRLSPFFIAGYYIFSKTKLFIEIARQVVKEQKESPTTKEAYLSNVMSRIMKKGKPVQNFEIQEYADLGTPEALRDYVKQFRA